MEVHYRPIVVDKKSFFKLGELEVGNKRVITPVKAFDLSKFFSDVELNYKEPKVNEIYKSFDKNYLSNLTKNNGLQRSLNYKLNSLINNAKKKDVNVFVVEYKGEKPNITETEFLIATLKSYSDFITIPAFSELREADYGVFEKHLKYLKKYIDIAKSFDKPIMGCIQFDIPFELIRPLIEFYLKNEVVAFCIDFGGRTPTSLIQNLQQINNVLQKVEYGLFIHAYNVNMGRVLRNEPVVPAKDVLSFGFGIDSLGNRHIKPRGPKDDDEYWARFHERMKNLFRLFDKANYGYYKIEGLDRLKKLYPKDSSIPLDAFDSSIAKRIKAQALLNSEQIAFETNNLKKVIDEEKVVEYVSGKKYVAEDVKKIEIARKTLTWSLDDFLS